MDNELAVFTLVSLLVMTAGFGLVVADAETEYQYDIKTEQVESDSYSLNDSEVTRFEDLSEDEQDALFMAYKKSDHFLGGASATIVVDEKLDLTEDERWRVVDIKGVRLLVGFHGPEPRDTAHGPLSVVGILVAILGGLGFMVGLADASTI